MDNTAYILIVVLEEFQHVLYHHMRSMEDLGTTYQVFPLMLAILQLYHRPEYRTYPQKVRQDV